MYFQLWHTESRNVLDAFETLDAALVAVHRYVQTEGPRITEKLSIVAEWDDDEEGDDALLPKTLTGAALLERIGATSTNREIRGVA